MTGFIVCVFPFRSRVSSTEAFEGLELGEGKSSRPVLRGPGGRKAAWLLGKVKSSEFHMDGKRVNHYLQTAVKKYLNPRGFRIVDALDDVAKRRNQVTKSERASRPQKFCRGVAYVHSRRALKPV